MGVAPAGAEARLLTGVVALPFFAVEIRRGVSGLAGNVSSCFGGDIVLRAEERGVVNNPHSPKTAATTTTNAI